MDRFHVGAGCAVETGNVDCIVPHKEFGLVPKTFHRLSCQYLPFKTF